MADKKNKKYFTEIFITQSICITVIIIIILITKFFFKNEYIKLKNFYEKQICSQTHVSEVLSDDKNI